MINGKIVAVKNNYQGVQYLGSNSTPTSIWVGCNRGLDGDKIISSVNPGIRVATVALWYWPIQLNELFSGGLGKLSIYCNNENYCSGEIMFNVIFILNCYDSF